MSQSHLPFGRTLAALALATGMLASSGGAAAATGMSLVGYARVVPPGLVQLTPAGAYTTGAAWRNKPVDLARGWRVDLNFSLGVSGVFGEAIQGDGIALVVQSDGTGALGTGGGGLGFQGLTSVASVIQTFDNNRVGLTITGDPYAAKASPVPLGVCHSISGAETVTYDPASHVLAMTGALYCDGVGTPISDQATVDLASVLGNRHAIIGMTAATGSNFAVQSVSRFVFAYADKP